MTRKATNAHVAIDRKDHDYSEPLPDDKPNVTVRRVLFCVLEPAGAELKAHEMVIAEQEHRSFVIQLACNC